MNRKMIGWIALAVIVVGGLFYGLNAALGTEPAPKGTTPRSTQVAEKATETSTESASDVFDAAKDVFEAIQDSDNDDGSDSPLDFFKDLGNDK